MVFLSFFLSFFFFPSDYFAHKGNHTTPSTDLTKAHVSLLCNTHHEKGTLEVGKLADFVALDADPLAVPHESIKDIGVRLTVMGGKITYARESAE